MLISRLESLVIVATKVFYYVKRAVCNVLPQFIIYYQTLYQVPQLSFQ